MIWYKNELVYFMKSFRFLWKLMILGIKSATYWYISLKFFKKCQKGSEYFIFRCISALATVANFRRRKRHNLPGGLLRRRRSPFSWSLEGRRAKLPSASTIFLKNHFQPEKTLKILLFNFRRFYFFFFSMNTSNKLKIVIDIGLNIWWVLHD